MLGLGSFLWSACNVRHGRLKSMAGPDLARAQVGQQIEAQSRSCMGCICTWRRMQPCSPLCARGDPLEPCSWSTEHVGAETFRLIAGKSQPRLSLNQSQGILSLSSSVGGAR
ncbi:uncharacterized protein MYCFIDRAFT_210633 [Pseudocercospora fijiensis CIRAD86]|uniref:Uncharacterized protein n=1 Tax=Pseudocercospora fijiensis (strain CIRAD86) TaxID=383855 RepID=M3BC50_PSEFD|nr:uncharacterized protein MYCFIDRAFT_210633 [Pseudocercospora fijiensis CIRAD86]EME86857.1 hypothetical protein MYCFIDRAFT_210633 [Pseudocercospora fijiensis CIRAD86]